MISPPALLGGLGCGINSQIAEREDKEKCTTCRISRIVRTAGQPLRAAPQNHRFAVIAMTCLWCASTANKLWQGTQRKIFIGGKAIALPVHTMNIKVSITGISRQPGRSAGRAGTDETKQREEEKK